MTLEFKYPPKNTSQLLSIMQTVEKRELEHEKKLAIFFYFLLDYGPTRSSTFLQKYRLPQVYITLMKGYWSIDHGDQQSAFKYFSDPMIDELDWKQHICEAMDGQIYLSLMYSAGHDDLRKDSEDLDMLKSI